MSLISLRETLPLGVQFLYDRSTTVALEVSFLLVIKANYFLPYLGLLLLCVVQISGKLRSDAVCSFRRLIFQFSLALSIS